MLTPPPPVTTGVTGSTAERNLAAFLSTLEATGDQNSMDALQVMLNRTALSKSGKAYTWAGNSLFEQITAREQFSPYSAAILELVQIQQQQQVRKYPQWISRRKTK
ncbi:MAG: hypothetical protein CM15mV3_2500 [Caudoviricetes sp.]|nr:MAG: hypothetical protein CM15mV3_2500 [Caudoviricetes sp.]